MSNRSESSRRESQQEESGENLAASDATTPQTGRRGSTARPSNDSCTIRFGRRAMACEFQLHFNADQFENAPEAAVAALDRIEELEALLTIYNDESPVCELNREAGGDPILVHPELYELATLSLRLHEITAGAFDVTAGPLSEAWGFARRAGAIPDGTTISRALDHVGSQYIERDDEELTLRLTKRGVSLNFGGIGKGFALDRATELLEDAAVVDFLFSGGRSSVVARGQCGLEDPQPWSVGVIHPLRPGRRLAEVFVRDRALSTSGSQTQSFTHQGRRYGHIIDPRNGQPVEGVLSVTVLAPTAAEADALSTALFVMGRDEGMKFAQLYPKYSIVFVTEGERAGSVDIEACNMSDNDWRLLDE